MQLGELISASVGNNMENHEDDLPTDLQYQLLNYKAQLL